MPNKPEYIILHHTAVSRETNASQFDAVNRYHKGKGWGRIGYHYFIEPSGEIKGGRGETEVGAHCYQKDMNYRSIGICFTGNFDMELPTDAQMVSATKLVGDIMRRYSIPASHVVGHRKFAPKSCPGNKFTDEMIHSIAKQSPMYDQGLIDRLKGRLLLQVQDKGQLYLVTERGEREYLGTSFLDYTRFFKRVRERQVPIVGISNEDLEKIPEAK